MDVEKKELYVGCECSCLDHIASFVYYPLSEEDKKDGEKPVIYLTLRMNNYFDKIFPPILHFWDSYDWKYYFYHNWFKRIRIAYQYIFINSSYEEREGILDCFSFQEQDIDKIDDILSEIAYATSTPNNCDYHSIHWIKNKKRSIVFRIKKEIEDEDIINNFYKLCWIPQLNTEPNIFKRMMSSFKYIFGIEDEIQEFKIYKEDAEILRGMIWWLKKYYKVEKNEER